MFSFYIHTYYLFAYYFFKLRIASNKPLISVVVSEHESVDEVKEPSETEKMAELMGFSGFGGNGSFI